MSLNCIMTWLPHLSLRATGLPGLVWNKNWIFLSVNLVWENLKMLWLSVSVGRVMVVSGHPLGIVLSSSLSHQEQPSLNHHRDTWLQFAIVLYWKFHALFPHPQRFWSNKANIALVLFSPHCDFLSKGVVSSEREPIALPLSETSHG